MANANQIGNTTHFSRVKAVRRKTAEACERCREKRIKVSDLPQPIPRGSDHIIRKLELVLSRLDKIESEVSQQAHTLSNLSRGGSFSAILIARLDLGQTSAISIASHLGKRLRQLEDGLDNDVRIPLPARRRIDAISQHRPSHDTDPKGPVLDELPSFCDYVMPLNAPSSDRFLNESIADRHVNSFFGSIHILIPILNPTAFKAQYVSLRQLLGDGRLSIPTQEDPTRPQFVCLMYAVLALGALYEDEQEDSSSWAQWYFSRAQGMLGRLLNASNLSLVQASLFLGAYAQHAIRPNLAYILNGVAARLAFSNGLNIESLHSSLPVDTQEAKRTWWLIYIQEVELCLDSGRPMCFGSSDMNIHYPTMHLLPNGEVNPVSKQDMFIPLLVGITKIVNRIIDLSAEPSEPGNSKLERQKKLLSELDHWRSSLPQHLCFADSDHEINDNDDLTSLYNWESRQQSSLQIPVLAILPQVTNNYRRTQMRKRDEASISAGSHEVNRETDKDDRKLCNLAIEIFEQIKLKASQRCADVIRHYLNTWESKQTRNGTSAASHDSSNSFGDGARQQSLSSTSAPLSSLDRSQASDHETEASCLSSDAAQARPGDSCIVESVSCSDLTPPCVSLSEFQAQLYSAFYGNPNDGFDFDQQSSFPGLETLGGYTARSNTIGTQDGVWTTYDQ
ncbi:hypothetical protein HG530_015197 [Fusarium avenaceum]|nr:hypothetical protein HG530_015197 [Fusarium avenaceum]